MPIRKISKNSFLVTVYRKHPTKPYNCKTVRKVYGTYAEVMVTEHRLITGKDEEGSLTAEKEVKAPKPIRVIAEPKPLPAPKVKVPTFAELVDLYLDYKDRQGGISKRYTNDHLRMRRLFGAHAVDNTFAIAFDEWYSKQDVSNWRKNGYLRVMAAILNHARAIEAIPENPIKKRRFPICDVEARNRAPLTDGEAERLFGVIKVNYPGFYPLILFQYLVPCRVGELTKARVEHYDKVKGVLYVPTSKTGKPLYKPVPDEIKAYFETVPDSCPWLFWRKAPDGNYAPWTVSRYWEAWRRCCKEAGLTDLRVHDLRHFSATRWYEAGIPEREIMDIAGWTTPMLSTYRYKNSLKTALKIVIPKAHFREFRVTSRGSISA